MLMHACDPVFHLPFRRLLRCAGTQCVSDLRHYFTVPDYWSTSRIPRYINECQISSGVSTMLPAQKFAVVMRSSADTAICTKP